jgi:hypothetical protein
VACPKRQRKAPTTADRLSAGAGLPAVADIAAKEQPAPPDSGAEILGFSHRSGEITATVGRCSSLLLAGVSLISD